MMFMKKGETTNMTVINEENYRIAKIVKIDPKSKKGYKLLKTKEGLAIEKRCDNNSYYVICFVKYNEKEHSCNVECVGDRILDVQDDEYSIFKSLLARASYKVIEANRRYKHEKI